MRLVRAPWLVAILILLPSTLPAQVEFDAASIKESKTASTGGTMRLMPGGGITAHLPARQFITIGYKLQPYQLVGAPDWTRTIYWDVVAKPAAASAREQTFTMLQALLKDRFKFAFHRETRQVDGFSLVRLKTDTLGPNLHPSAFNCEANFASTPKCREGGITTGSLKATGAPIWNLLQMLIAEVGGPVDDNTQMTGTFDLELRWSNELAPADNLPTIFTAVQEQLGLKLERRKVTVEVVVVDHIERPESD